MMGNLLPTGTEWNFIEESYTDAIQRYSGFGAKLFTILNDHFPGIINHFKFFRSAHQKEDVFAIYENLPVSFAIQLDPLIEVIVIWNKTDTIEIGTWSANEYKKAVDFIETILAG